MTDFKIRRGRYDQLFDENGILRYDSVVLELGCWYLCTDEAWLFLCVEDSEGKLDLKQINSPSNVVNRPTTSPDEDDTEFVRNLIGAYINEQGELVVLYSDDTEEVLGSVTGAPGQDGLVTSIQVGDSLYTHKDGLIQLPSFATKEYVAEAIEEKLTNSSPVEIPTKISDLDNDLNFVTETFVKDAIAEAELANKDIDLSGYATKEDIPKAVSQLTNDAGYITAKDIPSPDFTNFYTKAETTSAISAAVQGKADKILFTNKKYVTNPIGNFDLGINIAGMTLEELFTRLLGLTDKNPAIPDDPEVPNTVVDKIILEELSLYQIDAGCMLKEVPYVYIEMTSAEAAVAPTQAGFYQIIDNDEVIESGYQQFTSYENEIFYTLALPESIQMNSDNMQVTVQIWDNGNKKWVATSPDVASQLTCDYELIKNTFIDCGLTVPDVPNGYTLWANLDNVNNGEKFRYIIKEVIA